MTANAARNTKERLITTAMDLIWESSYGSVSVDGICKAANVNKGSFYHYFPSKIDLAIAAMDEAFSCYRPILDDVFSSAIPPVERFENFADFAYQDQKDLLKQHGMVCGCPFVSLASEMAPQDQSIRDKTIEITEDHYKYYRAALLDMVEARLLPKDEDIEVKTKRLHAFIIGQLVMARIENSIEPMGADLKSGLLCIIGAENKVQNAIPA